MAWPVVGHWLFQHVAIVALVEFRSKCQTMYSDAFDDECHISYSRSRSSMLQHTRPRRFIDPQELRERFPRDEVNGKCSSSVKLLPARRIHTWRGLPLWGHPAMELLEIVKDTLQ
ncbi:hypothetical protein SS1G_13235 [Sclerotinia sclerotiorum 1980 UF-70]|uniref:Secreted protein n=1 Tax=Sclerotinia sclerotiorum (strain ATCC 18683 / 1980 / Ss-1) TaxID=665079 RepID=A7F6K6_SCLS1|nr:hypothetical protein SS1G_13235 [Sclerotinia sclerotiorum 1980 UF-70]EDN98377.1 hypothetical protein SS1G_13235 [Sclerotinia sclerotiorum 1980 UF-70]